MDDERFIYTIYSAAGQIKVICPIDLPPLITQSGRVCFIEAGPVPGHFGSNKAYDLTSFKIIGAFYALSHFT
ncbi:MAG: hypothetical protein ACJA13_003365 [Paraglaciecola sp.]|jgi:hypothetical protein